MSETTLELQRMWEFPKIGGPQYRLQSIMILIIGTLKMVPLILGNPHVTVTSHREEVAPGRHPLPC